MAKVPIIDSGFLGLNSIVVRIEMIKKYTLAALLNWNNNDKGAQVSNVYLVVRTLFEALRYWAGMSFPNLIVIFSIAWASSSATV